MESRKPKSIFNHIASREFNSFHVQKRPKMDKLLSVYNEIEAIHLFNDEFEFVPFALSFSKTSKRCYDLAVADEDGYVTLFDTRCNETKEICEWIAHKVSSNVFFPEVYDLCWIKEDTQILTASGDKTVKVWDLQHKDCLGALRGHTDFVKSICSHPTNHDIIVSGSRDKSFRLWDLRCKSNAESGDGESSICSTAVVKRAHLYYDEEDRQVDSMSITSVLWLKDQVFIATAGSKDRVPKFWDTRYLKQDVTYTGLLPRSTEQSLDMSMQQRLHGLTSLSQDDHGVFLSASCKDNRIYLYNVLQNKKEPLRYFEGDNVGSFSGKAAISPDALNIGCCSREGKVYIWQLNKTEEEPTILSPTEEDSASCTEFGKFATSGDYGVRIWNKEVEIPE